MLLLTAIVPKILLIYEFWMPKNEELLLLLLPPPSLPLPPPSLPLPPPNPLLAMRGDVALYRDRILKNHVLHTKPVIEDELVKINI
jgi:hypothetical protein